MKRTIHKRLCSRSALSLLGAYYKVSLGKWYRDICSRRSVLDHHSSQPLVYSLHLYMASKWFLRLLPASVLWMQTTQANAPWYPLGHFGNPAVCFCRNSLWAKPCYEAWAPAGVCVAFGGLVTNEWYDASQPISYNISTRPPIVRSFSPINNDEELCALYGSVRLE